MDISNIKQDQQLIDKIVLREVAERKTIKESRGKVKPYESSIKKVYSYMKKTKKATRAKIIKDGVLSAFAIDGVLEALVGRCDLKAVPMGFSGKYRVIEYRFTGDE